MLYNIIYTYKYLLYSNTTVKNVICQAISWKIWACILVVYVVDDEFLITIQNLLTIFNTHNKVSRSKVLDIAKISFIEFFSF